MEIHLNSKHRTNEISLHKVITRLLNFHTPQPGSPSPQVNVWQYTDYNAARWLTDKQLSTGHIVRALEGTCPGPLSSDLVPPTALITPGNRAEYLLGIV